MLVDKSFRETAHFFTQLIILRVVENEKRWAKLEMLDVLGCFLCLLFDGVVVGKRSVVLLLISSWCTQVTPTNR